MWPIDAIPIRPVVPIRVMPPTVFTTLGLASCLGFPPIVDIGKCVARAQVGGSLVFNGARLANFAHTQIAVTIVEQFAAAAVYWHFLCSGGTTSGSLWMHNSLGFTLPWLLASPSL